MKMLLMSEKLLEKEIKKLSKEESLDEDRAFLKSIYEKELAVLRRLGIEFVNTAWGLDEVKKRLEGSAVYFLPRGILEEAQEKAAKFDTIQTICRSDMSVTNVLPNGVSYNADEIRC